MTTCNGRAHLHSSLFSFPRWEFRVTLSRRDTAGCGRQERARYSQAVGGGCAPVRAQELRRAGLKPRDGTICGHGCRTLSCLLAVRGRRSRVVRVRKEADVRGVITRTHNENHTAPTHYPRTFSNHWRNAEPAVCCGSAARSHML